MQRSDNLAWSQVKVGMLILVAILLFAGGVMMMGDKTRFFVPKGKLSVIMTDVMGLKVGAPVWLSGVDVGIVTDVRFEHPDQSNEIEVVLEIDRDDLKKIGKDSVITVKTRGLLGEKYVDITPSRTVSEIPETRLYGTATVRLDDVMKKAGSAFDRLNGIVERMDKGEGSLGRFTQDPGLYNNLVRLTGELNLFAGTVNRGEGTLGRLYRSNEPYDKLIDILTRADETLAEIQHSEGTMSRMIHDRQLYDKLVAVADTSIKAAEDVRELNRKLTSRESTIGMLLSDREFYDRGVALIDRADNSVRSFQEIADRVKRGEGTAGKLVSDDELYKRLSLMVDDVDLLVKDIKKNPKRYVQFSLF